MRKVIFFDRDGIINDPPDPGGYVDRAEAFRVMPEFIESLRIVHEHGYEAIVITNQQGVGKGLYSEQTLAEIHDKLRAEVVSYNLQILDVFYCPHLAAEGCDCRKPLPGMILDAADKWNIELDASWMVGDSFRDVDSGDAAGCRTLLVNPNKYLKATKWVEDIGAMPRAIRIVLEGDQ